MAVMIDDTMSGKMSDLSICRKTSPTKVTYITSRGGHSPSRELRRITPSTTPAVTPSSVSSVSRFSDRQLRARFDHGCAASGMVLPRRWTGEDTGCGLGPASDKGLLQQASAVAEHFGLKIV
ncbi:Protein of unknown function [Gryllus bimaculatus]|nr:Protein of unknown function [Gryllus bimaculatus]